MSPQRYSSKVRLIGVALIVCECLVLIGVFGYIAFSKYKLIGLKSSITRIDKKNIVASPSGNLTYYYEWSPYQTITHIRSWLPKTVTAVTNSDGIIGQTEYTRVKPNNTFRIVAIGDSFTEGPYVEADDTYPKQLETMLNITNTCSSVGRYEVLNLGVGGFDLEYAANRLLTKGMKYAPDLVIWLMKDDDFIQRAEVESKTELGYIDYVRDELGGDIEKFDPYKKWLSEIHTIDGVVNIIHGIVVREQIAAKADITYFPFQEDAVHRVADATPAPVVIATFQYTDRRFKARMKLWSKLSSNIHYFGEIPNLEPGSDTFEPHDGHPNDKGYQIIADSIVRELVGKKLICRE